MRVRRAPREVYRVYSEDEFFGEETLAGEAVEGCHVAPVGGGDTRWHAAAGATIAAAAIGAIGGLIALTWSAPAPRGGRRVLFAAAGSLSSSHLAGVQVWRVPSRAESQRRRRATVRASAAVQAWRGAGMPVRAAGTRRSRGSAARQAVEQMGVMTPAIYEATAVSRSSVSATAMSAGPASPQPAHVAASEFGFER